MSENSEPVIDRASLREADLPAYVGIGLDRIVLVDTEALAEEACAALLATDVIGFDTESKPITSAANKAAHASSASASESTRVMRSRPIPT